MKRTSLFFAVLLLSAAAAHAQDGVIAPRENLVVEGVPAIPASLAETAGRYADYRTAGLSDWHPSRREMLISTRFGDTNQLHLVKMPGGAREQLTFFADAVSGGGWQPLDWSPDDKTILLLEEISINELYVWLVDTATGEKKAFTPRDAIEKVSYGESRFSKDGKGIYTTTDKDSEFHRLAYIDLTSKKTNFLTNAIPWDVGAFDISHDGARIAFLTDEEGIIKLHVLDTRTGNELSVPKLPPGVIGGLRWRRNGRELGFTMQTARGQADCYSLDVNAGKLERWTFSESAVKTEAFPEAELIHWKRFDGKMISGLLYQPPVKFTRKRPVLVEIHGGPEGQSLPGFLGRNNYYLNKLGIALIFPNVRGSTGYGKTFSLLDNGFHRDDTYKDISALFDWIAARPDLDADRIAVTGGSYGGHMTLAVSLFYSDRIRCSIDVVGPPNLVALLEHTED